MPRTLQQYLDDHNGDHAAALAAAVADVGQREGENGTARSFRRMFEPVLRELDIPATQDGADQLREQLSGQGDSAALTEYAESLTEVLEGLGINFSLPDDQLNAAIEALPGQWQAYRALGDDPAALATRLTAGDTAVEREQGRELAEASNGASPSVLADRLRQSGLRAEVRNVPAEGATPARREVRVLNAEGQDQGELRTYATANWADYLTSLYPTAQGQQRGTPVAAQAGASAAGAATGSSLLSQRIAAREQAAAPAAAATQGA